MKNIFKVAIIAIALTMTAVTTNAQEKGDMAIGLQSAISPSGGSTFIGFGAKVQYNLIDQLRIEGSFNYYLPDETNGGGVKTKTNMWNAGLDAHWLLLSSDSWFNIYPLVGFGVLGVKADVDVNMNMGDYGDFSTSTSASSTAYGVNLGGGMDFNFGGGILMSVDAKYMLGLGSGGGGQLICSVGVGYRF